MTLQTYERILGEATGKTRMLHLQGWGEPLLNPSLLEMIRLAKSAGMQVGTTTNGLLMTRGIASQLVQSGLDRLAFSLAGIDCHNDDIRRGTSIERVLEAAQCLREVKGQLGRSNPAIHIAYMLLRSGMADIYRLPDLLSGLGVEQVVLSTLDFVTTSDLVSEALDSYNQVGYLNLRAQLDEVVDAGRQRGIPIFYRLAAPLEYFASQDDLNSTGSDFLGLNPLIAAPRPVCTENIQRAMVISANGDVSPCVYLNVPVYRASYFVHGEKRLYQKMTFGNVNQSSLDTIWNSRPYRDFRNAHRRFEFPDACRDCEKLYLI